MKRLLTCLTIFLIAQPVLALPEGSYKIQMIKPVKSVAAKFEDKYIKIRFSAGEMLSFELENKSEEPITIDWNKISFVDFEKRANKVIHTGIKMSERDRPQPETLIPPASILDDGVIPVSNISYGSSGWQVSPTFSKRAHRRILGKQFALFFPLKIGNKTQNYNFTFNADSIIYE